MMDALHRPAVVIGGDVNGLGIVRSLARGRVPVTVVDRDLGEPAMRTRFAAKVAVAALEGEALLHGLAALRRRFDVDPVLFLTREKTVATAMRHREAVARHYRIALPERPVLEPLLHKASFQALAQELGFPVPRAAVLKAAGDLDAARALDYPCVLKPAVKSAAYDARFKKAYKVADFAELERLFAEIAPILPDLIVQEWIEGGDDSIYFCLQYRSPEAAVASFTGRKIRSWPPRIGGTASCLAAPEHAAALDRMTSDFFAAVGFFGMGSMEYKRDARTGRFLMIEPTVGRTDFQEEVATLNGVNIPLAAWRHECGLPVTGPAPPPRRNAVWRVARIDRWSREQQPASGAFPAGARIYDAWWRPDDPAPWLFTMKARLAELLRPARGAAL